MLILKGLVKKVSHRHSGMSTFVDTPLFFYVSPLLETEFGSSVMVVLLLWCSSVMVVLPFLLILFIWVEI